MMQQVPKPSNHQLQQDELQPLNGSTKNQTGFCTPSWFTNTLASLLFCCEPTVIILEKEKESVELVMQMLKGKWQDYKKNASKKKKKKKSYFVPLSTGTYSPR